MFSSLHVEIERVDVHTYKICAPVCFLGKFCSVLVMKTHALEIHQGEIFNIENFNTSTDVVVSVDSWNNLNFELSLDDKVYILIKVPEIFQLY